MPGQPAREGLQLTLAAIDVEPDTILASIGEVFARFDTQDSGNVSYGVRVGKDRFFVKTAGRVDDPVPALSHVAHVKLLPNAVELARVSHSAIPALHEVIESPTGPMFVYDWFDGEPLHAQRANRGDPASAFQRALPVERIVACLPAAEWVPDGVGQSLGRATEPKTKTTLICVPRMFRFVLLAPRCLRLVWQSRGSDFGGSADRCGAARRNRRAGRGLGHLRHAIAGLRWRLECLLASESAGARQRFDRCERILGRELVDVLVLLR